ncbi:MAG: hypothetical protein KY432_03025 [Acidobacteria bacterium]|nr:hypothetical protein [Acidobacteriota bacterium]
MTYPDRELQNFLAEHFVFLQIDLSRHDPSLKELFREVKPFWAPLFRATAPGGIELRRWFGFLPPEALMAELELVLAHDLMLRREDRPARDRLQRALEKYPRENAAPEIMFWMGVAGFKAGDRDFDELERIWRSLIERWPQSSWASRADVFGLRS